MSRSSTEPTLEVPSTGLSLEATRQVVRRVFGLGDLEVTGEFVCHKPECLSETELWVHFSEDGGTESRRIRLSNRYPNDEELAEAALFVLERADPFAAALHHVALAEGRKSPDHISRALILAERRQLAPRDIRDRYWSAGLICNIKRRQKIYDEAITWCKTIREKEPGYSYAQNNLGILHLTLAMKAPSEAVKKKHFERAIAAFAAAIYATPNYANAVMNHGYTLMKSGSEDYALIERRYKYAIELNPTYSSYYYSISDVYGAQRRYIDQILALKWAIAMSSDASDIELLQRKIDHITGRHP
jgi:tetratricopeptide (TPR) repeat protein